MLAQSNLERSRVAHLDDVALAQHDAALLQGLDAAGGPPPLRRSAAHGAAAAAAAAQSGTPLWAASAAIPMAAPAGLRGPTPGLPSDAFGGSFSIGAAGPAALPPAGAGRGVTGAAAGGVAASAPSKLSPLVAAAGQRRRRGGQ